MIIVRVIKTNAMMAHWGESVGSGASWIKPLLYKGVSWRGQPFSWDLNVTDEFRFLLSPIFAPSFAQHQTSAGALKNQMLVLNKSTVVTLKSAFGWSVRITLEPL